jgi:microcompartment protein CcmL/EutN
MTAKAVGLIETIGLAAAIEAADAAVKAANITLLGYENTKGGGRITVKFVGDVGAVQSAVAAGSAAALRLGQVESCLVMPRPHHEIEALLKQVDRGKAVAPPAAAPPKAAAKPAPAKAAPTKPKSKPKPKPAVKPAATPPPPPPPPPAEPEPPAPAAFDKPAEPPTASPEAES